MRCRLFFLLLYSLLCSCASVSVKRSNSSRYVRRQRRRRKILVKPPTFNDPGLRVDRSGVQAEDFQIRTTGEIHPQPGAAPFQTRLACPGCGRSTAPLPRGNYWLITGRFDTVNQEQPLAESSVVGFGAGGTKLDMSVVVYDLSKTMPRPILLIETTGGSNATPGAIGTAAYFATGVTALFAAGNLFEAHAPDSHSTRFDHA